MCGIVGFFGDAGNNLTRVLTAMSAITYRAPDSTGIGFFGDDTEPLRTRKSLGAVAPLVETLAADPAYPNAAERLRGLWVMEDSDSPSEGSQRHLLAIEGLAGEQPFSINESEAPYPSYEDLVDPSDARIVAAGEPGRPGLVSPFRIRSKRHFERVILELTQNYDLSPVAVRTLLRKALQQELRRDREAGILEAPQQEILAAFDRLFDKAFFEERGPRPRRLEEESSPGAPYAEKILWRYLPRVWIRIPADYDRDGVRCLFRLLDAALLSRIPHTPGLVEEVQKTLESLWPEGRAIRRAGGWKALYWAEKGLNVYGRAAAAALAHLERTEIIPELDLRGPGPAGSWRPAGDGRTDPYSLRYLALPILSQGRWALQSPVTIKNAHPFFDRDKKRLIVLNGQFSGEVEDRLRDFLEKVAHVTLRSRNSSEYFSLLWGYYFDLLESERDRYEAVLSQTDQGLQEYGLGSLSIDYQVYHRVRGKARKDLDALAFIEAARRMIGEGGQLAVSGMSVLSPRTLYVASHNRPVFVVKREYGTEFMAVSDINAAMGLFPQAIVHRKTLDLHRMRKRHEEETALIRREGGTKERVKELKQRHEREEEEVLEALRIRVYPLEGEEVFARIETRPGTGGKPERAVTITDFDGNRSASVEPFSTVLNPLQTGKDVHRSFYETHLHEVPERFEDILRFHVSDEDGRPRFELRENLLRRHFGRNLASLDRIVLLGMGSAHHAGVAARRLLQRLLPGVDVLALRPAEVEDLHRTIMPEKDLVMLLSWSGTTADMVRAAKELGALKTAMIGVTEKRFSDMGLLASKSIGVIPVLSGEEVTVPGLKSILCMLFSTALFGVWLSERKEPGSENGHDPLLEELQQIPEILSRILADQEVLDFCRSVAAGSSEALSALVIDALHSTGTGLEAAYKMEETSWTAVGRSLDYGEIIYESLGVDPNRDFIMVNATNEARLPEALEVMRGLAERGIPFASTGFVGKGQGEMEELNPGRLVLLPKVSDELQPFVDLVFYYLFAFHFGLAHGRTPEDFPRNRAKSVTAGRSPMVRGRTPAAEALELEVWNAPEAAPQAAASEMSLWEEEAEDELEAAYYRAMRSLAEEMERDDPLESVLARREVNDERLSEALFDQVPDDGEMVLVPFDRGAHAVCTSLSVHWSRLLGAGVRVAGPEDLRYHFSRDLVTFFTATSPPGERVLSILAETGPCPCLYCGPEGGEDRAPGSPAPPLGWASLHPGLESCAQEALYAAMCLLFIHSWGRKSKARAAAAEKHFRLCSPAVRAVLASGSLRDSVRLAVSENLSYQTAFFIGPPGDPGPSWVHRFDRTRRLVMESHVFGESVHGPLVTVDSRVREKFVRLEERSRMVSMYGESPVREWEARCLQGEGVDDFLSRPPGTVPMAASAPFYAEGEWFFPVLRPDYNAGFDNLIILDATSNRFSAQLLDEMATYGCRHSRLILITQEALETRPERRALYRYPIGHVLTLPALGGQEGISPIPDLALPLAMNLLGNAMAHTVESLKAPRGAQTLNGGQT